MKVNVQKTNSKDCHDSNFPFRLNLQLRNSVNWQYEDRPIRNDIDGRRSNECSFQIDTSPGHNKWVPDLSPRNALEYSRAQIREVEPEVGPDQDMDGNVRFACSGYIEEPSELKKDG